MVKRQNNVNIFLFLVFIEKCTRNFNANNPPKNIVEIFNTEIEKYEHLD